MNNKPDPTLWEKILLWLFTVSLILIYFIGIFIKYPQGAITQKFVYGIFVGGIAVSIWLCVLLTFPKLIEKVQETKLLRVLWVGFGISAIISIAIGIIAALFDMVIMNMIRDHNFVFALVWLILFLGAAYYAENRGNKLAGYIIVLLIAVPILGFVFTLLFAAYMLHTGK